jgi:hypothetical protein
LQLKNYSPLIAKKKFQKSRHKVSIYLFNFIIAYIETQKKTNNIKDEKSEPKKLQASNSKKEIPKVSKVKGKCILIKFHNNIETQKKINNIMDDKSEIFSNNQHTTAFETVNSKTRKDT